MEQRVFHFPRHQSGLAGDVSVACDSRSIRLRHRLLHRQAHSELRRQSRRSAPRSGHGLADRRRRRRRRRRLWPRVPLQCSSSFYFSLSHSQPHLNHHHQAGHSNCKNQQIRFTVVGSELCRGNSVSPLNVHWKAIGNFGSYSSAIVTAK